MSCCAPSTRVVCLPLRCLSGCVLGSYTIVVIRYPNRTSLGLFIFRFHCAPAAELHVSGASCAPGARGAQRQTDSAHATTDDGHRDELRHHRTPITMSMSQSDTPWRRPRRADATRRNIKLRTQTRLDTDLSPHLTSQPQACPVPGARESEEPRPSLTPPPTRSPIFALAMCRECHRSAWLTLSLLPAPRRH